MPLVLELWKMYEIIVFLPRYRVTISVGIIALPRTSRLYFIAELKLILISSGHATSGRCYESNFSLYLRDWPGPEKTYDQNFFFCSTFESNPRHPRKQVWIRNRHGCSLEWLDIVYQRLILRRSCFIFPPEVIRLKSELVVCVSLTTIPFKTE